MIKKRDKSKIYTYSSPKGIRIKEILLGIAIAIIFLMFCVFGTKLLYDAPKYEDYCDYSKLNPISTEKTLDDSQTQEQQEMYTLCSEQYELANKNYSKNMFIISLIFSVLLIAFCTIFINVISISGGLMLGSIMFMVYGTGRYWNYMDNLMRFAILGIALVFLIYIAYWASKKMNNQNKKIKKSG
jgi:hypothetical protein